MDAIRRSNPTMSDCDRPFQSHCADLHPILFVFLNDILDSREGMTVKLQYWPLVNRYLLPHLLAKPRAHRGAIRQSRVHAQFACRSHRLHQKLVRLQAGNIAALLLVETPAVSRESANYDDRFSAPGALATVHEHCTGSAAIRLRSFQLHANHHFGGQL